MDYCLHNDDDETPPATKTNIILFHQQVSFVKKQKKKKSLNIKMKNISWQFMRLSSVRWMYARRNLASMDRRDYMKLFRMGFQIFSF